MYPQDVFKLYQAASEAEGLTPTSYRSFCRLWRDNLAHVVVMKPMTDLCHVCQKNSTAIMRAANCPEELKSEVCHVISVMLFITWYAYQTIKRAQLHLDLATEARSYMRAQVETSRQELVRAFPSGLPSLHSSLVPGPGCNDLLMHYSFDFAQQVGNAQFKLLTYTIPINARVHLHYSNSCTGHVPTQPPAAGANLLPHPPQMRPVWRVLRGNSTPGMSI